MSSKITISGASVEITIPALVDPYEMDIRDWGEDPRSRLRVRCYAEVENVRIQFKNMDGSEQTIIIPKLQLERLEGEIIPEYCIDENEWRICKIEKT